MAGEFPPPRPFQLEAHERLRDGARAGHRRQVIMAPTGGGKCLGRGTPVLMHDMTVKAVEDVLPGDKLMGPDWMPRNVLETSRGFGPLYIVTQDNGTPYIVNRNHILSLKTANGMTRNIPILEYLWLTDEDKSGLFGWRPNTRLVHGFGPVLSLRNNLSRIEVHEYIQGDYFGFEIDGDHLFLLGDFTVTHNTYLGMQVISEAIKKGKRAAFICDRRTLVDQTSETADRYGLGDHGIKMAGHWRRYRGQPLMIASLQTIARRDWQDIFDVIVVDECHSLYSAAVDLIGSTRAMVVGLSATPFSKGLGKVYSNLINAATMHELTESGVLVPMRVFTCRRPDMTGAKTVAGEWSTKEASQRGMEIIGDVVTEWSRIAFDRKTIVFGADIKHCHAICKQFLDSGIMAAVFTSETKDDERQEILQEFHKPDSIIRVLISVEALAKGFDCIAEGSIVLTQRGPVAIENVLNSDKLWDGHEWVTHGGVICKGERDVITYAGLSATEDHLVKTDRGWVPFGECKRLGLNIRRTGNGRKEIREDDDCFHRSSDDQNDTRIQTESALRLHSLWETAPDAVSHTDLGRGMPELRDPSRRSGMVGSASERDVCEMSQSGPQALPQLRRTRDRVSVRECSGGGQLDNGKHATSETRPEHPTGPDRQQRPLRAREHSVGNEIAQLREHETRRMGREDSQVPDGSPGNHVFRQDSEESGFYGAEFRSDSREVLPEVRQAKRRVWDILDAGPRNCFTCEGLLVHNCPSVSCVVDARPLRKSLSTAIQMWGRGLRSSPGKTDCILLDHSGNVVRMREDFEDVYFNGLASLDDGERMDKTPRKEPEFEERACPKCGYKPFIKRCVACGHQPPVRSDIVHDAGTAQEITIGKQVAAKDTRDLWAQCVSYARSRGKPETAYGRASHLYKDVVGTFPPKSYGFEAVNTVPVSRAVMNKVRQKMIAYSRGRR